MTNSKLSKYQRDFLRDKVDKFACKYDLEYSQAVKILLDINSINKMYDAVNLDRFLNEEYDIIWEEYNNIWLGEK